MTPHQLVKGIGNSVPLELHPEHSTKPKGPKLWEAPGQLAQGIRL